MKAGFYPSFFTFLSQHFLVFHVVHTPHMTVFHISFTHPIQHGSGHSACSLAISLTDPCLLSVSGRSRKKEGNYSTGILHYSFFSSLIALLGPSLFPSKNCKWKSYGAVSALCSSVSTLHELGVHIPLQSVYKDQ